MADPTGLAAVLALAFIIPIGLAKAVVKASWPQAFAAVGLLWALLLLLGIAWGSTWGERLGWPMIFSLFFSIPLVPAFAYILKRTGAI